MLRPPPLLPSSGKRPGAAPTARLTTALCPLPRTCAPAVGFGVLFHPQLYLVPVCKPGEVKSCLISLGEPVKLHSVPRLTVEGDRLLGLETLNCHQCHQAAWPLPAPTIPPVTTTPASVGAIPPHCAWPVPRPENSWDLWVSEHTSLSPPKRVPLFLRLKSLQHKVLPPPTQKEIASQSRPAPPLPVISGYFPENSLQVRPFLQPLIWPPHYQ